MKISPPTGSKISMATNDLGEPVMVVPVAQDAMRYFAGIFMLVWLFGWFYGETTVGSQILSGNASAFHIIWLVMWTMGGIFAAYAAYRNLRPTVPESLRLMRNGIGFDSGVRPPRFDRSRTGWNNLSSVFPKRIRCEINVRQLQSLRLRDTETSNRLTVDVDNQRIEIAADATEVEREWLARVLVDRYGLAQVFTGGRVPATVD